MRGAFGTPIVLDRGWPGCPAVWVGTSHGQQNFMQENLRDTEVQRRRGTTSPDPEKSPEPPRGPYGGFLVGIPREEEKTPKSL